MAGDLLVRGGLLVDGTGGPGRTEDVRIRAGVVAEVGRSLSAEGEAVMDASGAVVAPGFIDTHTHYDPSLWWDPLVDPAPLHGVTTVVIGNCSLSLAPVRAPDRLAASDVFGFIEDIPTAAFASGIPWSWESYPQWRDALAAHGTSIHVAALVGHSNLRQYVMGEEAWERPATPEERSSIAAVLGESLQAGALGLSTSFVDQDRHGRPVPSRAADDEEFVALIDGLAAAPGGPRVMEFLPFIRDVDRQLADIERVGHWCGERGVPCTWNQLAANSREPVRAARLLEQARRLHAEGCRVYAQVSPRPFEINVSFDQSLVFVAVPAWNTLIQLVSDDKRRQLADPAWRASARTDWDRVGKKFTIFPVRHLDKVKLTSVRPGEERFLGASLADLVAARGGHPSDVLADWVLEHDLHPGIVTEAQSNNDPAAVAALLLDPTTVVGASDAGAHLQMMCGAGDTTLLLTRHVRDRPDLSLEAAVHRLTGRPAGAFGLTGLGVLAPGCCGDLVVFAMDELDYAPDLFVHDLPGGGPRLTRPPGGFRATVVSGTIVQADGVATGARPGGPLNATAQRRIGATYDSE
jgi:N-acyl-D-aspartate/D-glutamate deacylase